MCYVLKLLSYKKVNKGDLMSKVYVAISGNLITGGAETVRQFVNKLVAEGVDAQIYIHDKKTKYKKAEKLNQYGCKYVYQIDDNDDNLLIVVEAQSYLLDRFNNIKKGIMWLSLDYYFVGDMTYKVRQRMRKFKFPKILEPIMRFYVKHKIGVTGDKYNFEYDLNYHFYNCEYIRQYLEAKDVDMTRTMYICGPIRDEFFEENIVKKEDIILYNPAKGKKITKEIIDVLNEKIEDVKIIPIQNMKPDEIRLLMDKSKVYMDFGEFPGPERMPREAVIRGCNIITGVKGASGNYIDVPIPENYKYNTDKVQKWEIVSKINQMIENYEEEIIFFDNYREKVIQQKDIFEKTIRILAEKIVNNE